MSAAEAVTRSISHTECVSLTMSLTSALEQLAALGLEGHTDRHVGRADVWGTLGGQEWRLDVVYDAAAVQS